MKQPESLSDAITRLAIELRNENHKLTHFQSLQIARQIINDEKKESYVIGGIQLIEGLIKKIDIIMSKQKEE